MANYLDEITLPAQGYVFDIIAHSNYCSFIERIFCLAASLPDKKRLSIIGSLYRLSIILIDVDLFFYL